jgi:hypothetical protein
MDPRRHARWYDQPAIRLARECGDGPFDLATIADIDRAQLHPEWGRYSLNGSELADPRRRRRVSKDRHSRHARRDLFEQFQPFSTDAVFIQQEARGITARARQARNVAGANRVND